MVCRNMQMMSGGHAARVAALLFALVAANLLIADFNSEGGGASTSIRFGARWLADDHDAEYYADVNRRLMSTREENRQFYVDHQYLTEDQIEQLATMRVLLFVTTHLSDQHLMALEWIWPSTTANSTLLTNADVLFYTASHSSELDGLLQTAFPKNENVTVVEYSNDGYQAGAIKAMSEAMEKRWFDSYDWVIRVNPDVIIRNETWIAAQMLNPGVWGVMADCSDEMLNGDKPMVHTDFCAFRPEFVDDVHAERANQVGIAVRVNAELHATKLFEDIWSTGHAAILPDNDWSSGSCRVRGAQGSVIHDHGWLEVEANRRKREAEVLPLEQVRQR